MNILEALAQILQPLISAIEKVVTVIFVRKAAKLKVENEQLKKQNEEQDKRLEIGSRPPRSFTDILKLMRLGKR